MRPRHAPRLLLGTLLALLPGARALADGFLLPEAGSRLVPGAAIDVAVAADTREETDERELLLSLDGGETYPVRLTRALPLEGRLTWRVPALPTAHARLALRTGSDGRGETVAAVSGEFAILPGPPAPLEPLVEVEGEYRTRDALEPGTPPAFPGAGSLETPGERVDAASPSLEPGEPPAAAAANAGPPDDSRPPAGIRRIPRVPAAAPVLPRVSLPRRE